MRYAGSALMLFVTMAAAIGSYTVNLRVSGERAEVERLKKRLVADARDIRNLEAELRTRARLPEMQRWNDQVLQMSAPAATQYLQSPVQLASFGAAPAAPGTVPAQPEVRYAVATPAPAPPISAPVQRVAYRPAARPAAPPVAAPDAARILKASYAAAPRPVAPVPVATAPVDLIAEIDAALPAEAKDEEL